MQDKIRVLIGKMGMDGHDRGARVLTIMLRDAGMEVIYTGFFQTPEKIVQTAFQEYVDVIGLSFLSGEHLFYVPKVLELLREKGTKNFLVVVLTFMLLKFGLTISQRFHRLMILTKSTYLMILY